MFETKAVGSFVAIVSSICAGIVASACNPGTTGPALGAGGNTANPGGGAAGSVSLPPPANLGGSTGAGGSSGSTTAAVWPPPGYNNVTTTTFGAYALGPLLSSTTDPNAQGGSSGTGGDSGSSSDRCGGLFGVVRDFKMSTQGGPPDFEAAQTGDDHGIVTTTLGSDGKPVYANPAGTTKTTSGQANFDQWYRDVPGVNMTYVLGLHFVPNGNVVTFAAALPGSSYFPLDGFGFGNQSQPHNFSFTTEIHTSFTYSGGERFTFVGDDDVFAYINQHLVIDLGGIHVQENKTIDLDASATALGITKGNVYPLDVFSAERHTSQSNFRIDTTLAFTNCGVVNGIVY
jgi:fibro-slime domain-containing protein